MAAAILAPGARARAHGTDDNVTTWCGRPITAAWEDRYGPAWERYTAERPGRRCATCVTLHDGQEARQ
jgi:hypothetical protein